jgi:hypothetical protein
LCLVGEYARKQDDREPSQKDVAARQDKCLRGLDKGVGERFEIAAWLLYVVERRRKYQHRYLGQRRISDKYMRQGGQYKFSKYNLKIF